MEDTVQLETKMEDLKTAEDDINRENEGLLEEIKNLMANKRELLLQQEMLKEKLESSKSNTSIYRQNLEENKTEYKAQKSFFELMERIKNDEDAQKENQNVANSSAKKTKKQLKKPVKKSRPLQPIRERDEDEEDESQNSESSDEESILSIYEEDEDEEKDMLSRTMIQASKTLKRPINEIDLLTKKTPEETYTEEEIEKILGLGFDVKKMDEIKINLLMAQKNMKGDSEILAEYKKIMDKVAENYISYQQCVSMCSRLAKERDDLQAHRYREFMTGFNYISMKLKQVYQQITDERGDADLEVEDSVDPFSQGISYSVRPPDKSWKTIGKLSGGERTLASLALIFALHFYKPTPIYVMDEIDAALDFQNVNIVGNFIRERSKSAQFIVISLREHMFTKCNQLIGVHKVLNKSGMILLYVKDFLNNLIGDIRNADSKQLEHDEDQSNQVSAQLPRKTAAFGIRDFVTTSPKKSSHKIVEDLTVNDN